MQKSIKEYFEYDGAIPIEELMSILDDEWKYNSNGGIFKESSHWEDESRDEDKYIEISSIVEFPIPNGCGYSFSNKRVQKLYDDFVNEIYIKYADEHERGYYEPFDEEINLCEPIILIVAIDLKDKIIYADVDLGNGLGSTEVGREKLADNEKDFRKQIQRMIDCF